MITSRRSAYDVLRDVTFGLLMRELKTRYGSYRLGYCWALLDPLIMVGAFCLIFGLRGRSGFGGAEAPVFIISGYLPFLLFSKTANQLKSAVSANMGLFCYRQVTPFATLLARFILEMLSLFLVMLLMITLLCGLGFAALPADPLHTLWYLLQLALFAFALGMLFCIINKYSAEVGKFIGFLMMPLMIISGVIMPIAVIPAQYHGWLLWNPLLHAIELIRSGWIAGFATPYGDPIYLASCTVSLLALAMSAYRLNRYHLIRS